jgi:glycosyltransferase involved in cell wall biosynthesis
MPKLVILQGNSESLGGTLVTLALLIQGFTELGLGEQVCVPVRAGSLTENYLRDRGHGPYLKIIEARNLQEFVNASLGWVQTLPCTWPLLLDNCVFRDLIPILALHAAQLRWSQRAVFHFCHDLAISENQLGRWSRKATFALLAPQALCNSHFTAQHTQWLMPRLKGVLYQPVDTVTFAPQTKTQPPPANLEPILQRGAKIILMPTRLNQPGTTNDKNVRALIPILAQLKHWGQDYHGVVIGSDPSPSQERTKTLLAQATALGVAEHFTILPPSFDIQAYYAHSDLVVSLAPREPFGRTVIEALACGVPVVGSQSGGVGEILGQVNPQWRVDPQDAEAVAATILKLGSDPDTRHHLMQGRQWVEQWCSVAGYARRIADFTLN